MLIGTGWVKELTIDVLNIPVSKSFYSNYFFNKMTYKI